MRRMSGLDAQFYYGETPGAHMHTLKVLILQPSASEPLSLERLKDRMRASLHRLPPFRWRALPTPFGLHHPLWIEDPDFDLDYHIRRLAVPAPGGDRELCEVLSEIASYPLARDKPLWQLFILDGLTDGRIAAAAKVHHAIADGASSAELLVDFLSTEPVDATIGPVALSRAEPIPSRRRLVWMALRDQLRAALVTLPQLVRAVRVARRRRIAELSDIPDQQLPKLFKGPPTPFNAPLTPRRNFAFFTRPLDDAKATARAFGVTINDVFLSAVAGALRSYLEGKDALPDAPLIGGMPASTRTEEQRRTWGNQLASLCVLLRTDIADPIERLHATHEATTAVKRELEISKGARPEDWLQLYPPAIVKLIGFITGALVRRGAPSVYNVVVSNVPGPKERLYHGRAPVTNFVSVGPPLEGVGLNITVWSYAGNLNFGLISCRELVPDLWDVAELMQQSLAELLDAAARERARSA